MTVDPESLYVQLGRLIEEWPDNLHLVRLPDATKRWLARATALVEATGDATDVATLKVQIPRLGIMGDLHQAENQVTAAIYRAFARAELNAPASVLGAFIPVGSDFDALAAVGKVLQSATRDALIVDPYMDEKALTTFAVLAAENVTIRLLADQNDVKPSLRPAVAAWKSQYGAKRPLDARLAPPRSLHDRLLAVDGTSAWTLTQSLNAFAKRSPATIVRVDDETAKLKIDYYEGVWQTSANV